MASRAFYGEKVWEIVEAPPSARGQDPVLALFDSLSGYSLLAQIGFIDAASEICWAAAELRHSLPPDRFLDTHLGECN